MTQQTDGGAWTGTTGLPTEPAPTAEVARDQAAEVGRSTADAGRQVAGTAADQAGQVVRETRQQAGDLLAQARQQVAEQARGGQQQAVLGLRSLATELHQMADGGDEHGPVSDMASQAAGRVDDVAGWLERHEPGDVVEEVRRLARRRPAAFLVGAAVVGVLAGRLTRGVVDGRHDTGPNGAGPAPSPAAPLPAAGLPSAYPPPAPVPYQQPGGVALPPQGPLGAPDGPPMHTPGSVPSPYPTAAPGPGQGGDYFGEPELERPADPWVPR